MVFSDRTYSVLIVSSSEKFATALTPFMSENYCEHIRSVNSIAAAKRETTERSYDIVIINSPLSDDSGYSFAIDISSSGNSVCLCFVKADIYEEVTWRLFSHGVFTLSKPASSSSVSQAMKHVITTCERLRIVESKSTSLEDKMQEIKLVNRAKWLLIENLNMSEADAHHYIEKQAMNTCRTKHEIAVNIINTYK